MNTELSPKAAEIVATARTLIETGGFKGFSYADISKQVGIRKPSIHHHFPSKADLVEVVISQYRDEAITALESLNQTFLDPFERLQAYINYWSDCIEDSRPSFCLCALLAVEIDTLPENVMHQVRQHFEYLDQWMKGTLSAIFDNTGESNNLSASVEASAFVALVHGSMISARAMQNPQLFRQLMSHSLQQLQRS